MRNRIDCRQKSCASYHQNYLNVIDILNKMFCFSIDCSHTGRESHGRLISHRDIQIALALNTRTLFLKYMKDEVCLYLIVYYCHCASYFLFNADRA